MKAYIVGAGAQGRIVQDILVDIGNFADILFIDEDPKLLGKRINGSKVVGDLKYLFQQDPTQIQIHIALGNPILRLRIAEKIKRHGIPLLNVIHPSAVIMETAVLGIGNLIGANVVINSNTKIGNTTILNTAAVIEHDCVIEDGVSVSPCALISGRVKVKKGAFICSSAVILPRRVIGKYAVVAAGSVVTKNVEEKTLVMGSPAKVVERLGKNFNWGRVL